MIFSVQGIMGQKIAAGIRSAQEFIGNAKQNVSFYQQGNDESGIIFNSIDYSKAQDNKSGQEKNNQAGSINLEKKNKNECAPDTISEFMSDNGGDTTLVFTETGLFQLPANKINIQKNLEIPESDLTISGIINKLENVDSDRVMNQIVPKGMDLLAKSGEENIHNKYLVTRLNPISQSSVDFSTQNLQADLKAVSANSENSGIQNLPNVISVTGPVVDLFRGKENEISFTAEKNEQNIPHHLEKVISSLTNIRATDRSDSSALLSSFARSREIQNDLVNSRPEGIINEIPPKNSFHFSEYNLHNRSDDSSQASPLFIKTAPEKHKDTKNIDQSVKNVSAKNLDWNIQATKDTGNSLQNSTFQFYSANEAQNMPSHKNSLERQFSMPMVREINGIEKRIVNQIFSRLHTGVSQGSGNWTINLHPPELGRVKVKIISGKGSLNIHLKSHNHQVAGILDKHLQALQSALEQQGIELSGLQVSVESGDQDLSPFEEDGFFFTDRDKNISDLVEEEQDILLSNTREDFAGYSQGLSLRV